ncbi:MAG: hypothetical protein JWM46_72 [Candidatus Kaiserbacteria bacterium]|nr:hypothetical protein [Candidatus Kaiserbacteria bacterium]
MFYDALMQATALPEYKEHIGTCSECGNSPVNHFATYWEQTFAVWTAHGGSDSAMQRMMHKKGDALFDKIAPALFGFLVALPVSRLSNDPSRARTYRSQVIWEEAKRRGIEMQQVVFFGFYTEIYRARIRGRWHYFQSLPVPEGLDRNKYRYIDDKFLFKQLLTEEHIPAARAVSVVSRKQAIDALHECGGVVVVKPRSGSRGRHTSVNVRTEEEMVRAFDSARVLCKYVVVEEYFEGSVCRGTLIAGKLVGFLQADPPKVTGDGISSVRELAEQANQEKPDRVQDIVLSEDHRAFLSRLGYTFDLVIPKGERIALTYRTGRLFGGRTREYGTAIHPKLRDYLERTAALTGAVVVGFDLIIKDPLADPDTQKWGIIEGNSLPFIDLHYLPLEGTPTNVAAAIWDLWNI